MAPTHYMIALFPGFQLLDVAGPLDVLNLVSLTPDIGAEGMILTFIASTLDPVPTKPIPPQSQAWTFDPAQVKDTMNTTFNQTFIPDTTFDTYTTALKSGNLTKDDDNHHLRPVDVLLIPGGIGSRIDRISSSTTNSTRTSNVADLESFIQTVHPHISHSIITVCTGSDILAHTGLLDHRRATTNMSRWEYVTSRNPRVSWQRARRWVRSPSLSSPSPPEEEEQETKATNFNKPIYTSAGISAGIDVTLAFVAEWYGGVEVAREVARKMEYEWREIGEGVEDDMYEKGFFGQ